MSVATDVKTFVEVITTQPGWAWELDGKNHYRITNEKGAWITLPATPSDSRWRENSLTRLRRELGYDPNAAQIAKARKSAERIRQDREKNDARLARMEAEARLREEMAEKVIQVVRSGEFGEIEKGDGTLVGWPTVYRYITIGEAQEELNRYDGGCCPRRTLRDSNVQNWVKIMESGAFRLTGSPIIYTSCENRCLGNGQHRFWAMQFANRQIMEKRYPLGVPFQVISEFPPELIATLDSGKSRTFRDVAELNGVQKYASIIGTSVRMAMLYDESFLESGLPWALWNKRPVSNTEFEIALSGNYAAVADWVKEGGRLFTRARINKSAGTVLYFLLNRDSDDPEMVDAFFEGVRGEATTGDPRHEFARFAMLSNDGKRKKAHSAGVQQLGMGLRAFGLWRNDPTWRTQSLKFETDQLMWPVWKPGMKIIRGELRFPY